MNRCWETGSGEHYWMEISSLSDVGADLNAPSTNEEVKEQWSYELLLAAADGDVVFHLSMQHKAVVACSCIRGEGWESEVASFWGGEGN